MNMKEASARTIVVTSLIAGIICASVHAQRGMASEDRWQIEFSPYFWAPAVDADATVGGTTATLDLSFGDLLDNFDVFGLSGRLEAWKGKCWAHRNGPQAPLWYSSI